MRKTDTSTPGAPPGGMPRNTLIVSVVGGVAGLAIVILILIGVYCYRANSRKLSRRYQAGVPKMAPSAAIARDARAPDLWIEQAAASLEQQRPSEHSIAFEATARVASLTDVNGRLHNGDGNHTGRHVCLA